jgi:hypothetical protein
MSSEKKDMEKLMIELVHLAGWTSSASLICGRMMIFHLSVNINSAYLTTGNLCSPAPMTEHYSGPTVFCWPARLTKMPNAFVLSSRNFKL